MASSGSKKIAHILEKIHEIAPVHHADDWDNVGLLIGDKEWETAGAVVSVDLTEKSLSVAEDQGFHLIVNHHPCLFPRGRGLKRLVPGPEGHLQTQIFRAVQGRTAVICCHTNFDQSALEVVERVSKGLEVSVLGRLIESPSNNEELRRIESGLGYGFWGDLPDAIPFEEISQRVKNLFELDSYWMTQPHPKKVRRVAFVAGKGAGFVETAIRLGCDLFITGEAGYHTALHGAGSGMGVMELGHRESEKFFLEVMNGWLSKMGLKTVVLDDPTQRIERN